MINASSTNGGGGGTIGCGLPSNERLRAKCKLKVSMWARSHGSPVEEEEFHKNKKKVDLRKIKYLFRN